MNTRIKNLQGNLYNKDQTAVYGSDAMTGTAKSIVAKVNDLLKKKLPPEYAKVKEAQSKILQQRQTILKALKEEDNALALLSDDAIANMSEEAVTKLINDSIAGNKMPLVLPALPVVRPATAQIRPLIACANIQKRKLAVPVVVSVAQVPPLLAERSIKLLPAKIDPACVVNKLCTLVMLRLLLQVGRFGLYPTALVIATHSGESGGLACHVDRSMTSVISFSVAMPVEPTNG